MSDEGRSLANDAVELAEEIHERSIQQQAMDYVPNAMKTLGKFAKGNEVNKVKPSAGVVRAAARDIVEFAGGRPETRDPRIGAGTQNLTFIIQRFADGSTHKLEAHATIETELLDPIAVAERALEGIHKTFEVPDAPTDRREDP